MAFTVKSYKKAQTTRLKNNPAQKAAGQAIPTVPAGPKNSNGPKGGSSKTSTTGSGATKDVIKAKPAKVSKAKLNPTPKTPFNKSTRVNYKQLRSK